MIPKLQTQNPKPSSLAKGFFIFGDLETTKDNGTMCLQILHRRLCNFCPDYSEAILVDLRQVGREELPLALVTQAELSQVVVSQNRGTPT